MGFINHCKASVKDDLLPSAQDGPTSPVFSAAAVDEVDDAGSDDLRTEGASGRNCANMLPPTDRNSPRFSTTSQSISADNQYNDFNDKVGKT